MALLLETFAFQTQECFVWIHVCTHMIRLGDVILILFAHQKKLSKQDKASCQHGVSFKETYESLESLNIGKRKRHFT